MEPKCGLESIFIAIENDVKKVRLFREGVEGLGPPGPWARVPRHTLVAEGCASTKQRFAENRRQGCSILRPEFPGAPYILDIWSSGGLGQTPKHACHRAPEGTVADMGRFVNHHVNQIMERFTWGFTNLPI